MKTPKVKKHKQIEQKELNVTPRIVINDPVVNKPFKSILDEIFRFVSVGGDFN